VRDISQLVQAKERELHEMHELRCLQLEKMIEERDGLLQESTRRFDLLRDDFQYNLSLLEARDKEIGRLNQVEVKLEAAEQEKGNLSKRIEMMMMKECEKEEKSQQDKIVNKKILIELQNEVEALRWTTTDELQSKSREIEQARQEVWRVQTERDESLERQRLELTELYENMLKDREEGFLKQEENICQQVQVLEKRFQSLMNENSRLKSEGSQLQRSCEKLTNELKSKEERCNQLVWQVDDYSRKLQETEDDLYKKIQNIETENQNYMSLTDQMKLDYKRDVEKAKSDLKREKEFATLKNKHWEELHVKDTTEIEKLTLSLEVSKEKESTLSRELEAARERVSAMSIKEVELHAAISEHKGRVDSSESSLTTLQEELQEMKMKYSQLSDNYEYLENASKEQITKATEHMQGLQAEIAVVRASMQAEFIMTQEESEKAFHKQIDTLQNQLQDCKRVAEVKDKECRELNKALDDERAEGDAMRLRLTLQATTNHHFAHNNAPSNSRPHGDGGGGDDIITRLSIPPSGLNSAASPMFSEDFGTVSIPSSPMNFKSPYYHPKMSIPSGGSGRGSFPNALGSPVPHSESFKFSQSCDNKKSKDDLDLLSLSPSNHAIEAFSAEKNISTENSDNKRLKAIIKEMRRDAEALFVEMQNAVTEKEKAIEQVSKLEERLLHATLEVNKLREERRKLMDINNELRASSVQQFQNQNAESSAKGPKENNNENTSDDLSLYVRGYTNDAPSKTRASDRQTKSQQEALQKLKDKSMLSIGGTSMPSRNNNRYGKHDKHQQQPVPNRKVVNYANQNDFE